MNKIFLFLGLMLALAAPIESFALPAPADAEFRLNHGSASGGSGVMLGYQVFSNKEQVLKCQYSYAISGGSSAAAINLKAVDGSNCSLPNKAIVTDGIIDVVTGFTAVGTPFVALSTGQSAGDLKAAAASSGYTGRLATIPVGTAATAIKLTAARSPTLTLSVGYVSAGKINVYIKYLLGD